ncbi:NXPE family member 1-like isoform X2 [Pleurodeles waltl]|uniref:NXPE family member 1-like isoform X2 n=1 Tax=Pleurodeles waltl TaxID=8319 RepID=UPI00370938A2
MSAATKLNLKRGVFLAVATVFILSFCIHRRLLKFPTVSHFCQRISVSKSLSEKLEDGLQDKSKFTLIDFPKVPSRAAAEAQWKAQLKDTELQVKTIIRKIDKLIPNVSFTHLDNTTCAAKSKVSIISPRDRYCIGDNVTVQLDVFDYLGKKKKYGGDLLRARIYSPDLGAGASGKIQDFHNGTYQVQFTFFWEGKVKVSLFLIHSSEAVAALWRGRNSGYNYMAHKVKYTNATHEVEAMCGYDLDTEEEVCNMMENMDEYPFYCIKPAHMSCFSLTHITSVFTDSSYFTALERPLIDRSHIRAVIPHGLQDLIVTNCARSEPMKQKCKTGMKHQLPSGYFHQNIWHPVSCSMNRFSSQDEINDCLKGKSLHLIGDSTMIQWNAYFINTLKNLKDLELYGYDWEKPRLVVDTERNIQIRFQKHGFPFIFRDFYSLATTGDKILPEQIAHIGGNKHRVIAFTVGAHFRPFPLHIFIRRAINIRRAIQQLLLRSPETKVVLKTENTSFEHENLEPMSDFNGYIHYQILNTLLQDLNIGIVDAWDMTEAAATSVLHPPPLIIQNEITLFLTYIC